MLKNYFLLSHRIFTKYQIIYKSYARWTVRKPHRILNVEEYEKQDNPRKVNWREISKNELPNEENIEKSEQEIKSLKPYRTKMKSYQEKSPKKTSNDMLQVVFDENGDFVYTKMLNTDPRVGTLLTNIKSRKNRDKQELILLEGKRLILDALECKCILKYILFSRKSDLEFLRENLPKAGASLYKIPYKEMQMWSDLTTTPGIMGLFRNPILENHQLNIEQLPITFLLDNIREPGNLGAILRICAGVSCSRVILTKGCAHIWEPKVTRSAMGAHFRLQLHRNVEYDQISDIIYENLDKDKHLKVIIADTGNTAENATNMPIIPYYSHTFSLNEQTVIIIGGETEGISEEMYQFAKDHEGTCLNIALSNNTDSLNTAAALAVIAFEIKKQLTLLQNI